MRYVCIERGLRDSDTWTIMCHESRTIDDCDLTRCIWVVKGGNESKCVPRPRYTEEMIVNFDTGKVNSEPANIAKYFEDMDIN